MLEVKGHGKLSYKRANINGIQCVVLLLKSFFLSTRNENWFGYKRQKSGLTFNMLFNR